MRRRQPTEDERTLRGAIKKIKSTAVITKTQEITIIQTETITEERISSRDLT